MSNSIYRLLMQCVYRTLYPLIPPLLHPRQFGGRIGTSPAHATQTFLQDLDQCDNIESILAFDVCHAFESPLKALICQVLGRLGIPFRLLQLITPALEQNTTYIRGVHADRSHPDSGPHMESNRDAPYPVSCL